MNLNPINPDQPLPKKSALENALGIFQAGLGVAGIGTKLADIANASKTLQLNQDTLNFMKNLNQNQTPITPGT